MAAHTWKRLSKGKIQFNSFLCNFISRPIDFVIQMYDSTYNSSHKYGCPIRDRHAFNQSNKVC